MAKFFISLKFKMDKYEILEQVGKGSFGAVTKIRRKADNKLLVWKGC
jgi:hypothetical protein